MTTPRLPPAPRGPLALAPHDADLEAALLGSLLMVGAVPEAVRKRLHLSDFYAHGHEHVYAAMLALQQSGTPTDLLTLRGELERRGILLKVGAGDVRGPVYLATLADTAGTTLNVEHLAKRVAEIGRRRESLRVSHDLGERLRDPATDADAAAAWGAGALDGIADRGNGVKEVAGDTITTCLADVEALPVEWVWRGRIPAGMLTVLDGDPKLGKTTLLLDIAARVTRGREMPDGTDGTAPAGVVFVTAEDDLARVIRPRLDAAQADLAQVFALEVGGPSGETRLPLIVPADLARIESAVRQRGVRLVAFDPFMAFLPAEANANRDQDVRRALAPLRALAERTGAAVVLIRHLRKGAAENPLYRGGGSIGIVGAARSALLVAPDPEDESGDRRILAVSACNLAAPTPSLAYRLVLEPDAPAPRIRWEGASPHDATALLSVPRDEDERAALGEAKEFLREALPVGVLVPSKEVKESSRKAGVSWASVRRGAKALGVETVRTGFGVGGAWAWRLPAPKPCIDAQILHSCSTEKHEHLWDGLSTYGGGPDQVTNPVTREPGEEG